MSHDERLPECKEIQCELKETINRHLAESVPVRSDVEKHNHQIKTLEEARLSTMEDIKDIKEDLASVKQTVSEVGVQVSKDVLGVRIWVLCGVLASAAMFAIPMFSIASSLGRSQEKIDRLEQLHPYGSQVAPVYGVK